MKPNKHLASLALLFLGFVKKAVTVPCQIRDGSTGTLFRNDPNMHFVTPPVESRKSKTLNLFPHAENNISP